MKEPPHWDLTTLNLKIADDALDDAIIHLQETQVKLGIALKNLDELREIIKPENT